ncbi:MAG: hypothetical protein HY682_02285, partial [Chloroflexi bacterium]|nr:hypothetical protein [Chloroflexota bacterium]
MARCATHGFENCPYHGALPRTPVGAFRFCACFANHDRKTACNCGCGQCDVYRQELADSPVVSEVLEVPADAVPHPPDECGELCVPRRRWASQLQEIDTAASRSMIEELNTASTDVALRAGIEKAELVYFGELDRLSSQRAAGKATPQEGRKKQKKK